MEIPISKRNTLHFVGKMFNSFVPAPPQLSLLRIPSEPLHPPELPSIAPVGLGAWQNMSEIILHVELNFSTFSQFFYIFRFPFRGRPDAAFIDTPTASRSVAPRINPTLYAASFVSDDGARVDCSICLTWIIVT
jgi:hypothetical protein